MSDKKIPRWAQSLGADYEQFRDELAKVLADRGFDFDETEGVAERGDDFVFLRSLATRCSDEQAPWTELIEEHIELAAPAVSESTSPFETIRSRLRLALYPRATLDVGDPGFEYAEFGDDLIEVVCIDGETTVESVTREQMSEWGVSWAELRRIGAENLRQDTFGEISVEVSGGTYTMVTGAGYCTSGRAAVLPRTLARGLLIAVPNRHTVLYHRVRGTTSLLVAKSMAEVAATMFADGEGARSPNLHFAYEGELYSTTLKETEDGVVVEFPDVLMELMRGLDKRTRRNPDDPYEAPRDGAEGETRAPIFSGAVGGAFDLVNQRLLSANIPGFLWFCLSAVVVWSIPVQTNQTAALVAGAILLVAARFVSLTLSKLLMTIARGGDANWITAAPSIGLVLRTLPISICGACSVYGAVILAADTPGAPTPYYGLPMPVIVVSVLGIVAYGTLAAASNPFWIEGNGFIGGLRKGWGLIFHDPLRLAVSLLIVAPMWGLGSGCVFVFGFFDALFKGLFVYGWWQLERERTQQVADPFAHI